MANNQLTERKIITAKPANKDYLIADGGGLFLRVLPSGTKSWLAKFNHKGESIKRSLGVYPIITLAMAREKLLTLRRDPTRTLDETLPKTLDELFELWARDYLPRGRQEAGINEVTLRYRKHISPFIGRKELTDIKVADILAVLRNAVNNDAPTMANAALGELRRVFKVGFLMGLITQDPTYGIEVRDAGGKRKSRERYLRDGELVDLKAKLLTPIGDREYLLQIKSVAIILLALSTIARREEIAAARIQDLDLARGLWTIPAENSKNETEFVVHLNKFSKAIFGLMQSLAGGHEFVFPADRVHSKSGHYGSAAVGSAIRAHQGFGMGDGLKLKGGLWTMHDLRRTGSTIMGELGIDSDVIDLCLNHTPPKLKKTYQRQIRMQDRKRAFEALGVRLDEVLDLSDCLTRLQDLSIAKQRVSRR